MNTGMQLRKGVRYKDKERYSACWSLTRPALLDMVLWEKEAGREEWECGGVQTMVRERQEEEICTTNQCSICCTHTNYQAGRKTTHEQKWQLQMFQLSVTPCSQDCRSLVNMRQHECTVREYATFSHKAISCYATGLYCYTFETIWHCRQNC